jgi:spermidine synthase
VYRIYLLFFLSGAAGLVYQVVWSRLLNEIFGVTVYAVATVLATFLAGLALGSVVLGRLADRRDQPLRFYGWLEIGIAFSALLGLLTIRLLDPAHIWAATRWAPDSPALIGARVLLGALVVLPPTFLMGGTLPAITRVCVDELRRFGRELSFLYALNTLGAVVGTLATGFLLIRWFGMHVTLGIAVALNLAVGVVSLALARTLPRRPAREREARDDSSRHAGPRAIGLLPVMTLSGIVSLGLEVFWTRILMLSVGTTTYSFATMLASFLTGIALGGFVARRVVDRLRNVRRSFGWIQLGIAATVLAALPLIDAGLTQRWLSGWGANWVMLILLRFGVSLLIMLVPTVLIGMTFPLAAKLWTRDLHRLGGEVGQVYGANTLGNILGALVAGFVLLPVLGLQKGMIVLTLLNLAGAAWGFWPARSENREASGSVRGRVALVGLAAAAAALLLWQPRPFTAWDEAAGDRTLYYREGVVNTVKVIEKERNPDRVLMAVDSITIGESLGGVDHKQQALAHFPFLLMTRHPPRRILSVGLGSGILMGEVARHPEVEEAVCLEISPSVIEAARLFERYNDGVMDNRRVRVINDDGVNFLRRIQTRFDAIISDAKSRTTHAANATFFSLDYYRLCREHLAPHGAMIQWIPLDVPPEELDTILRTFLHVFPYAYVWAAPPQSLFVVGTEQPLTLEPAAIQAALEAPATANLRRYGIVWAADFVGALTADGASLRPWLDEGTSLNSLRHPVLEFYSLRAHAVTPSLRAERNLINVLRGRDAALTTVELAGPMPVAVQDNQLALGRLAGAWRALEGTEAGDSAEALRLLEEARRKAASNRVVQHGAAAGYRLLLQRDPRNLPALVGLGRLLLSSGRLDRALARFRQALEIDPDDPQALLGAAHVLALHVDPASRDAQQAVRLAARAVELTGRRDPRALATLADTYFAAGRADLALEAVRAALPLAEAGSDPALLGELRSRQEFLDRIGSHRP